MLEFLENVENYFVNYHKIHRAFARHLCECHQERVFRGIKLGHSLQRIAEDILKSEDLPENWEGWA